MREQYRAEGLTEDDLAADPMHQFARWFRQTPQRGMVYEPNAMVVSTADRRRPASLPHGAAEERTTTAGFVFFTNYNSRKGRELAANPYVSLLFPWHPLARQVVVTGAAARIGRDETAAYFRTRPHGSQLGAWASEQSGRDRLPAGARSPYEELAARYPEGEHIPAPPHWGGFRVVPETHRVLAGPREPAARPAAIRTRGRGRGLAGGAPLPRDRAAPHTQKPAGSGPSLRRGRPDLPASPRVG